MVKARLTSVVKDGPGATGETMVTIGSLRLDGNLLLAPLDGYGDPPFRLLCRSFGAAMSYVPIVPAEAILTRKRPKRPLIAFYERERPLGVQFLCREPLDLARAIESVLRLQPALIDLNLGCPARKVVHGGRGAALMKEPQLVARLAQAAVGASAVPVTAKIRLGWDEQTRNHVEISRILADSGVAAIAVHGRTRAQAYSGEADWRAIREVREAVTVPVIANGDVIDVASARAIVVQTGCPAAMVARGAIGNPWIFAHRDLVTVPLAERLQVLSRHLWMSVVYYGAERGVVSFRKHVVQYIKGFPGAASVRTRLMQPRSAECLLDILAQHVCNNDEQRAALYREAVETISEGMGELCV